MNIRDKKYLIKTWFWFEFFLPFFLLFLLWPITAYFIQLPHSYARVFSSADLIPLGALLILGVWREIETESRVGNLPVHALENYKLASLLVPILILINYGFVKYQSITIPVPNDPSLPVDGRLFTISLLSLAVLFFAGGFCYSAKWELVQATSTNAQ